MRQGRWWVAALTGLAVALSPAQAEDERGRWTFSLGGGILSTRDDIRNNASTLLLEEFGRPNDISDDRPILGSIDPRQDDLLGRETEVEERQAYNFSVAYGLTSWLSLQLDLGYYKGNVSNLDTFRISRQYVDVNPKNNVLDPEKELFSTPPKDASVPISVGRLEQIPVMLSAMFRFRKDSPFNPILGAGVGWLFTDLEESALLRDLNDQILRGFQRTQILTTSTGATEAFNPITIEDSRGNTIVSSTCATVANDPANPNPEAACTLGKESLEQQLALLEEDGLLTPLIERLLRQGFEPLINEEFIPRRPFITTEVEGGFAYQLSAGAEYHFNRRWSAYVLGRYLVTRASLEVRISDNGNLVTPTPSGDASQAITFETDEATFRFNSELNCDNVKRAELIRRGETPCLSQPSLLTDSIIVQGGKINLTSFTLGFGIRYTF